jgi:hypothetical protein
MYRTIVVLTNDEGDDKQKVQLFARDHNVRPLIKHRAFISLHKA